MTAARFVYTGIRVRNLKKSIRFYTKFFGMKVIAKGKIPSTKGQIAVLKNDDSAQELELNYYPNNVTYETGEELDHLAFEVDDLDALLKKLELDGIKPVTGVITGGVRWSRWCYIADPDGIWIELNERKSANKLR